MRRFHGRRQRELNDCPEVTRSFVLSLKERKCHSRTSRESPSRQEYQEQKEKHEQEQKERHGAPERASRNEHTSDRVTPGLGGCAPATAHEGEGIDPRP